MIYNGKEASIRMQNGFKKRIQSLSRAPVLAILSVGTHPSTASFVKIKKKYAEAVGIEIKEFNFSEVDGEESLISRINSLSEETVDGIIVQLPLPSSYSAKAVLDIIPEHLDVDVLGASASATFERAGTPVPPVAGAVAHILRDTNTRLENKNVVVVGRGKLVGVPVSVWFMHHDVTPRIIDIATDEEMKKELFKEADIVISGAGSPKMLKPDYFREGVVLLDAGTSEQGGVLFGDCDPACEKIASVFTPVPGGIGPLTVAYLFENVIASAEKKTK